MSWISRAVTLTLALVVSACVVSPQQTSEAAPPTPTARSVEVGKAQQPIEINLVDGTMRERLESFELLVDNMPMDVDYQARYLADHEDTELHPRMAFTTFDLEQVDDEPIAWVTTGWAVHDYLTEQKFSLH